MRRKINSGQTSFDWAEWLDGELLLVTLCLFRLIVDDCRQIVIDLWLLLSLHRLVKPPGGCPNV